MTIVTPDRNLGTGHSRQGEPPGTGDRRKGPAGGGTSPDAEVERHASTGGASASSGISGFCRLLREGGARRGRMPEVPRPRLEKKGIGYGEVNKERFGRPLAGVVSRDSTPLVEWRRRSGVMVFSWTSRIRAVPSANR